jgi:hypothetical protein
MARKKGKMVNCGDKGDKGKLGYFFDFSIFHVPT